MKKLIYILFATLFITSCSKNDDDNTTTSNNDTENLQLVQEIQNEAHSIEIYTANGMLYTGHNSITIKIKDIETSEYITPSEINWMPMMQMQSMNHSCPKSALSNNGNLYTGFTIFQMTGMNGSGWSLKFMYTYNEMQFTAEDNITVLQSEKQNVTAFMGTDGNKYVLATITPKEPIIGNNDLTVGLFQMENMHTFPAVENYTIKLDPRMPSMGNHSSPNNTDLTYNANENLYDGNLSLTMSGYWVLNLQLLNDNNDLLKGEEVTESTPQSSLYLEIEF